MIGGHGTAQEHAGQERTDEGRMPPKKERDAAGVQGSVTSGPLGWPGKAVFAGLGKRRSHGEVSARMLRT